MLAQRIAVIGAGAVGGVLAAAAHQAGHRVTLCLRTPFDKLALETPSGTEEIPVALVSDPDDLPEVDWVLLTTKVQDIANTEPWLRRFDDGRTPVTVVQNGVEHRDSVAPLKLRAPLLPALIYVSAERVRPGHVVRRTPASMIVPTGELGARFSELLGAAELDVTQSCDFHTAAWRKMLTNVAANPITALTMRRLDVLTDSEMQRLAAGLLAEAVQVARAEGAEISNSDTDKILSSYAEQMPADNGTSMLYDRLAGLPTEHEHITGALVRAGQRHDIDTPLNHTLLTLLRALRP